MTHRSLFSSKLLSNVSYQVLSTLNAFMSSSSMQIELDHVPTVWKIGRMEETLSNASTRAAILRDTVKV